MSCAATAMKMKQLMRSMLLTFTLLTCLHLSVGQQINFTAGGISQGESCGTGNSQDTNGSLFQHQLNQVLDSLVVNVSRTGFDTSSVEGQNNNDFVYGLLQCRGDLNSSLCKQCASTIKTQLVQNCKNSTSGYLQLEGCFLRYDNHYFYDYSPEDIQSYGVQCNVQSIYPLYTFPFDVSEVLSNITERAVGSPKLYAADVFEEKYSASIYSLAQCWGDLSQASCNSCLSVALRKISPTSATSACSPGSNGARFYAMGCHLRYEIYPFFYAPTSSPPPTLPDGPHTPIPSPPAASSEGKKRNVFAITVGVVAATVGLIAAIGISRFRRKRWERISRTTGEISLSPSMTNLELIFKYDTLRRATSDFKAENKLGEGGFGSVFKGVLPDGREVAIKRLNIDSRQGDNEFLNEANLITRVQHRNLVRLLGCSVQRSERLLVYEYLHNSSLDKIIFDTAKRRLLNWRERYDIIVGTARGLAYLHEESEIRIIHRDIKASNILLDDKYRPKIADFGLAKLFGEDESHVSTRVAGTRGYIAPESLRGQLTEKVDVFSFGVLLLEIISGRKNHSLLQHMEFLIETTWRLYNAERALEVMDPTLEGSYSGEEGLRVIKIGLLCTQAAATLRPSMSQVVSMLTGEQQHIPLPTRPAFVDEESVLAERGIVTPRRGPNNTSSNSQSLEVATYCSTPSLTTMEPR
eukprot:PITA_14439